MENLVDELYEKFYEELRRYLTGRGADAEDILQETFLRAVDHEAELEPLTDAQRRAWLYRAAKNLAADRWRETRREGPKQAETAWETDFSQPEVDLQLLCLDPRDRSLFYLRYFCGYNATELGAMFSMKPSHVRMRLKAARKILKKELELYE